MSLETLVITVVVAAAAVYLARYFLAMFKPDGGCRSSGCGGCQVVTDECSSSTDPDGQRRG